MNKFLVLFLVFFVRSVLAQSPQQISYQGVARNASGTLLSNSTIAVKFDIHQGSVSGNIIFSEAHQGSTGLITNSFGLFTTSIGSINNLSVVNWSAGPFFIEVSIDPLNGTDYNSVGTQQLMSVPYALYAEKAGNVTPTPTLSINAPNVITNPSAGIYSITIPSSTVYSAGQDISITSGTISNLAPDRIVTLTGTGATTITGSYPTFTVSSTIPPGSVTPTITGTGATTVTGTYPSLTINTPVAQTYTAGSGIGISGGIITNTSPAVTPTLSVVGNSISITPGNTQLLPDYSLTPGNTNLTVNQTGTAYTLTPVTPTLNVSGGSITGAYPSQTLTIPTSSTTLVPGNNITLNQSGSTYTITSGSITYTGTPGNVSVTGTVINLEPTGVITSTYGAAATNAVPVFSVDVYGRLSAAGQYTPVISGDVSGSVNTATVSKLRGISISTVVPTANQVLQYDGTSWLPSTFSGNAWGLNGNAGTDAYSFIGTTDNNKFTLKTNNVERAAFTVGNHLNLFMGDNANPGSVNLNGNVSNSIQVLEVSTASLSAGSSLDIIAGNSKTGTANAAGGTLNLVSGASTGNSGSTIDFATASPVGNGSARSNPDLKMRLTESGQLLVGNTSNYSANAKLVVLDGHIESTQTTAPSVTAIPLLVTASLGSTSTDVVGTITISTPLTGLLSAGNYARITFNKAYNSLPVVILTPTNANAAGIGMYVTGTTLTDFTVAFSQTAALLSSYTFNYIILEGQ